MANYNSLKNSGILKPVANTDLGSPTNTYGNLYMSGNVSLNGTLLNSTNAVTPRIASIAYVGDDTAADPAGGQTITITGSGFSDGAAVYVGGTIASAVTVVSSTQLTFTSPVKSAGSYSFNVVNTDGATAMFIPGMQYSGVPAWTTSAGSLGSPQKSSSVSYTVAATGDAPVTYSVISGALPSGLSLNSTSGVISGTTPDVGSNTTYNFTIRASDAENQNTDRAFSLIVMASNPPLAEMLLIAGGGAGGQTYGGGGGAGGLLYYGADTSPKTPNGSAYQFSATTYTITVGAGGVSGGSSGSNSSISANASTIYSATGGGGGGSGYPGGNGASGGSGGGAAGFYSGGTGTTGQGKDGGGGNMQSYSMGGGGGGGAGVAGSNGSATGGASGNGYGGAGGNGLAYTITGSSVTYAGGGGGYASGSGGYGGAAGTGGGSAGGFQGTWPSAATPNTGGGGGGSASATIGTGGSGVVIIRYADTYPAATSTTGSPTYTTPTGYRVYKFTSSGSITF